MIHRDVGERELAQMVSRVVKLAPRGRVWVGLCPAHVEKTPSFYVFRDRKTGKGMFRCYGCGIWGDALDWLMRMEGKTYREAQGEVSDPELVAASEGVRRYEERRQRILQRYRDYNRDCPAPDWAIDTTGGYNASSLPGTAFHTPGVQWEVEA